MAAVLDRSEDGCLESDEQITGRYSVGKLLLLREYEERHGLRRVACVLVGSLLPAIMVVHCIELLPLGDPRDGLRGNVSSLIRSMIAHGIFTFMFLLTLKQAVNLSNDGYSLRRIAGIAIFTSFILEATWLLVAVIWGRYPVPFREFLGIVPWLTIVVLGHALFARGELSKKRQALTLYLPVLGADMTLFYLFLALAVTFARVPTSVQIAMVLSFPLIKVIVKKWLWMYSRHVHDLTIMVTICMADISGALYQALCLQYASTRELSALIMLMDCLQVALEVRMYLGDEGLLDTTRAVVPALKLLDKALAKQPVVIESKPKLSAEALDPVVPSVSQTTRSVLLTQPSASVIRGAQSSIHARVSPQPVLVESVGESILRQVDGVVLPDATESQVQSVEHALHRIFSCEVLVFVEYMEVFMPLVYSVYVRLADLIPQAHHYNLLLTSMTAAQIQATTSNALKYAGLEGLSFVIMCWFMKSRYGISPLHQLAFVLETYWMTLQGKLVGCFITILCALTMHQGVDFTFRFDYDALLAHINAPSSGAT